LIMRAYLPSYDLRTPGDLPEALTLFSRDPGVWKPFAGGTDLMVLFEAGKLSHKKYVNIWNLAELGGISVTAEHVTLGSLTTYSQVQANDILQQEFPMLCQAAFETGGLAIQNRGTLGGNIANASPAGDSPPALLVYDAQLELISVKGSRWIPYNGFHTGYKQMLMRPDELIKSIRLPRSDQAWRQYYRKVGTRKAQAISKICFAGVAQLDGEQIKDIRIALGSVGPIVVRCKRTEDVLKDRKVDAALVSAARAELAREIKPIDDVRSTAKYRLQVAMNVLEDFLLKL
jgi:CO/xanthine dehydrogenase FAD-binding subunit